MRYIALVPKAKYKKVILFWVNDQKDYEPAYEAVFDLYQKQIARGKVDLVNIVGASVEAVLERIGNEWDREVVKATTVELVPNAYAPKAEVLP